MMYDVFKICCEMHLRLYVTDSLGWLQEEDIFETQVLIWKGVKL